MLVLSFSEILVFLTSFLHCDYAAHCPAVRGTLFSLALHKSWPTAEKIISGPVPRVEQLYVQTTLTAVKRWSDQSFLFPSVWACTAQCKASREMRRVGIASGPTVSQLCRDRLRFCFALTSRAVCVLPRSLQRRGGRGTARWACLVSASTRSGLLSGHGS